ncbi:MAG: leucine--tRNA ligase [Dehalococcoidales bacterium]|nr:MAG: leucine--tRNA ligase [Dehalococcoidales bacterium]
MESYDFREAEKKWQGIWEKEGVFKALDDSSRSKYYVLVEFPGPSGEGLHIGHPRSYVALDIVARKRRMEGYNVLYPMGWDAFGLPTENYAIKTGQHPSDITQKNITKFKRTMKRLGLSFDWSREINTTEPDYYKWTQWIFLKMWEHGLAYKSEIPVNWCESCKVGLANEEVIGGRCERCDSVVTLKKKQQWMLRITAYAERLLRDLDTVEYLLRIKTQQINWIGRSPGAEIDFPVLHLVKGKIKVFTTRPDTLYGVTYLVLSPKHEFINGLLPLCKNRDDVTDYVEKSDRVFSNGYDESFREMTGVQFEGIRALNPANKHEIPIWVSNYVLSTYGTGAIMAVPGHDKRDWRFARRYGLPVIEVVSGGDIDKAAFTDIDTGVMVNSGPLDGLTPENAIENIMTIIMKEGYGRPQVQYKLRDWVFSRQRFWGEPIPMILCEKCGWVPVPESELPLTLPEIASYQQTITGESPLAEIEEWVNTGCPVCGGPAKRETDTMPQWAGSSWYYLRYCDPRNEENLADRDKLDYWNPVDWYNGGMEHTTLHLLYSRFWHKFLYDIGIVPSPEPYLKRTSHGMILGENGEKMSKSRGNVVNPDDILNAYGADALRLYEVFMGDYDKPIPWSTNGLVGIARFLQRVWKLHEKIGLTEPDSQTTRLLHQTIRDVGDRIENMKFNTAVSSLMEMTNHFSALDAVNKEQWEIFLKLLSPFASHIGEELWAKLGKSDLLCTQSWPVYDASQVSGEIREIPVQVNGKLRGRISLSDNATDVEIRKQALKAVSPYIRERPVCRIIVAGGKSSRIVNIVVTK